MVGMQFIRQTGNGGAAMRGGNHSSQAKAGGGGGADTSPMGDPVAEERVGGGLGDEGNMLMPDSSELVTTGQPDPAMVRAFEQGQINTPVMVTESQVGRFENEYRAIDANGARVLASARAAGVSPNVVVVPDNARQIASARATSQPATFNSLGRSGGLGEVGNMISVPRSEIRGGPRSTLSQRQINAGARAVRANGGRAWQPIAVRQVGRDSYQPISTQGANALAIASRAGAQPYLYVVSN